MRVLVPITLLAALLVAPGCASRMAQARRDVPTVLKVKIVGNRVFADGAIREELAQRQTSVLHFIPPFTFFQPRFYLEGTDWQDDRTRIANFYARRGYFDARVVSSQIVSGKQRRPNGEPEFVRVVHTVQEGSSSALRTVTVEMEEAGLLAAEVPALRAALVARLSLAAGSRFSESDVLEAESALVDALQDRSYATAVVRHRVDAYPEENAVDVTFLVSPGSPAVFGAVTIGGLEHVAERYVRRHVLVEAGKPWDGRAVRRMKQEIYGMGVFSMVTVNPDLDGEPRLDGDGRRVVDLDIVLRERKPRSFAIAGGVEWDVQGFSLVFPNLTFGHINLGRRLIRSTVTVKGGYRYLGPADHFPTAMVRGELSLPDFPARQFVLRGDAGVELGVEKGYKFWTPSGALGLGWAPLGPLKFDVSYNIAFYDLFQARLGPEPIIPSQCPEVGRAPGDCVPPSDAKAPDFPDNYLLAYTRESVMLDLRDNPLAANSGLLLQFASDQAFPFGRLPDGALRGFRYVRFEGEVRGFIPIVPARLVLGVRAGATHVETWGDEHQIPVTKRVYLGGDGSMRGFKSRYLGPRALDPACSRRDCIVPLGARTGISGSVELRFRPIGGVWLAAFTDLGRTWGDGSTDTDVADAELLAYQSSLYDRDKLQISVGGGLRYDLSIGRVRIDFAARIRKWPEEQSALREPFPWNIHFNLGESF